MSMRHATVATALCLAAAGCAGHANPADTTLQVATTAGPDAALPKDLRVVAFNVHMEPGEKVAKAIHADAALRDADLIMLEEVHAKDGDACSGACVVGRELGYYAVYAPGHVNGKGTDGIALLSKSPILSAAVIELPHMNSVFNTQRKVAIEATVLVGKTPVTVYTVHLDNRLNVKDRRTQMLPVLERAEKTTTPVIIAGDFNTSPFTWIHHVIPVPTGTQDNHLEELVRKHGFQTPCAGSGPTSQWLAMKLDAIYTRGFDTVRFSTADAQSLSDHYALWADVHLKI